MADISPERALIYAILKGGITAFQQAKSLGVQVEHLHFDEKKIFGICEAEFVPRGRMPTLTELQVHYSIDLPASAESFDVDLCSKNIVTAALITALSDGLAPVIQVIQTDPYDAKKKLAELIQETNWTLGSISRSDTPQVLSELMQGYLDAKTKDGSLRGLSSPWPSRDKQSLGLQKGEVTVILAKRKTGKSWFLFKWIQHIWRNKFKRPDGTEVPELGPKDCLLVVSLEMPDDQVWRRIYAIDQKLDYELFRAGRLPKTEEDLFFAWHEAQLKQQGKVDKPSIMVVGSDRVTTVNDIIALVAQYRPRAVFIDGLYILEGEGKMRTAPMWERVSSNMKAIKIQLARGMSVPVVGTTQLSGQVKRGDLNAEADAVAYGKSIGDWCDAMDGLFGNDKFRDSGKRILRGMEARDFKTVDLEINFNPSTQDYSEVRVLDRTDNGSGDEESDDDDDDASPPGYTEDQITLD